MNEHDSERIAGLLTADGYVPTGEAAEANVIVFNTCAIRENADNRLYGNLGHLRPLKERNPRMRIVVAGCLAQKDGATIREHARGSTSWSAPTPCPRCSTCSTGPRPRDRSSTSASRPRSSRAPFPPSARSRTTRGFRSRWGVTTPARSASCRSCAGRSLASDRRRARRGPGPRAAGRGRGDAPRSEREHVRPRPHCSGSPRRPLFADLLRAVNGSAASAGSGSRARTPRLHARRDRRDGRGDKVCEHIHFPLQSGSDRVLKAMQRSYRRERYLGWLERIRAAIPDIAVSTDIIVGFPGETEEDFRDTLDVVRRARFDQAYTFQYSPGRDAPPRWTDSSTSPSSRSGSSASSRSRSDRARTDARAGGVVGRGADRGIGAGGGAQGRTRTNRVVHVGGDHAPGRSSRRGSSAHTRTTWTASSCGSPPPSADDRPERLRRRTAASLARRSRPRRRARPEIEVLALSAPRSSRSTRCSCTAGWISAPPSRPRSSERASRTISSTSPNRRSRSASPLPGAGARGDRQIRSRDRPCRRRARRSTSGRWWTSWVPATDADIRKGLEAEAAMVGPTGSP